MMWKSRTVWKRWNYFTSKTLSIGDCQLPILVMSPPILIEFLKVVQEELSGCTYALCPKTTLRGTPKLRFIVISRDFETARRSPSVRVQLAERGPQFLALALPDNRQRYFRAGLGTRHRISQ